MWTNGRLGNWRKSDAPADRQALQTCLGTMIEALRSANALLAPVMPTAHAKINERLHLNPAPPGAKIFLGITDQGQETRGKNHSFPKRNIGGEVTLLFLVRLFFGQGTSAPRTRVSSASRMATFKCWRFTDSFNSA